MENEYSEWDESKEQRQKRYEELYRYAMTAYSEERKRLEEVEVKAMRLFPLVVLLLGFGSFGIREAVEISKGNSSIGLFFLIPYFFFYITTISSIFAFLYTIGIRDIDRPTIADSIIETFDKYQYLEIIYSLSDSFLSYARNINTVAAKKYEALQWAYWLLEASVVWVFLSTLGYIITKIN